MEKLIAIGKCVLILWMGLSYTWFFKIAYKEPESALEDLVRTYQWH